MEKEKAIEGVIAYFRSDQWRRLWAMLVQDTDPRRTHAHVYAETCVDPGALQRIIEGHLAQLGRPIARRIDVMAPKAGMGSLHGVEPKGLAHFDWNWFFNPEVALAGTQGGEKGESGCNLLGWNGTYIEEFYSGFPFRSAGPRDEDALRAFFKSDYWHDGLAACTRPDTNHGHINCYTSIHPGTIRLFAEESLREKGWEIYYTCPNVYLVDGQYTGKLVFMGKKPEAVYDLGWKFKADTVIGEVNDHWVFADQVNYDIWTQAMVDPVLAQPYLKLNESEIQGILNAIAPKKG